MARGFDSKSVADQQEEMLRSRERRGETGPPTSARKRSLELARLDLERRLQHAPERHRAFLLKALADLDELIRKA